MKLQRTCVKCEKNWDFLYNGTSDSNIRRQLKRLGDVFLIEKVQNKKYRTYEFTKLDLIVSQKNAKINNSRGKSFEV